MCHLLQRLSVYAEARCFANKFRQTDVTFCDVLHLHVWLFLCQSSHSWACLSSVLALSVSDCVCVFLLFLTGATLLVLWLVLCVCDFCVCCLACYEFLVVSTMAPLQLIDQGCVRGQHGRGQGQGQRSLRPRPRPQNFVLEVEASQDPHTRVFLARDATQRAVMPSRLSVHHSQRPTAASCALVYEVLYLWY